MGHSSTTDRECGAGGGSNGSDAYYGPIRAFQYDELELSRANLLSPLLNDMLRSLAHHVETGSMADVFLVGTDGRQVPANRFVLAARSPVFGKMLYGGFREASSNCVEMVDYSSTLLEAIVHYCNTETVPVVLVAANNDDVEASHVRFLVDLVRAADYLELLGLQKIVTRRIHYLMTRNLPLSIVVFDQADPSSELSHLALHILETRPYLVFGENNHMGIECLSQNKVVQFFKSSSIAAGELFLFQLLQQWYEHHSCQSELLQAKSKEDKVLETAHHCCRYIQLANIEPSVLLDTVSSCAFCPPELVFNAIAQQALQASQRGVWVLSCRGGRKASSVERLLVEGCGMRDAQGVYYRVMGLAQGVGGLYTKREASAGQEWVYTLSCATKGNSYDCRLFRSKLLTQGAVANMARMQRLLSMESGVGVPSVVFQPVLQAVWVKTSSNLGESMGRRTLSATGTSSCQFQVPMKDCAQAHFSDGEHFIVATLSEPVAESLGDALNAVVKVLEYHLYSVDGRVTLHVNKVAVLHSNLGHWFGQVKPFRAIHDEPMSRDPGDSSMEGSAAQLLQNPVEILYTCSTPVQGTRDRNAPCSRHGWIASDDLRGSEFERPPSVMWIPHAENSSQAASRDVVEVSTLLASNPSGTAGDYHNR